MMTCVDPTCAALQDMAMLTMAILTMALLTMAILTMAILTMALLTCAAMHDMIAVYTLSAMHLVGVAVRVGVEVGVRVRAPLGHLGAGGGGACRRLRQEGDPDPAVVGARDEA